ncbi:triose-phosphate isomerase [Patescibacteria group bacterium]|nr:triose-phosphate isomerase [Patescibacteria group bacterium]
MRNLELLVANWKSNKTIDETETWLHDFSEGLNKASIGLEGKRIIIAPPFTSLEHARYCAGNLKLAVEFAAQDISPFTEGAYTGAVSAKQIKELANYVIIGHSERRREFAETDEMLEKKVAMALRFGLTPIFCIQNENTPVPQGVKVVAYEPPSAIGTGNPDTPENASNVAIKVKDKYDITHVLYGGSVTGQNIADFIKMPSIDGVLVGGASLNPLEFLEIIKNA